MELEADVQINGRARRPLKPSASGLVLPAPGAPPSHWHPAFLTAGTHAKSSKAN